MTEPSQLMLTHRTKRRSLIGFLLGGFFSGLPQQLLGLLLHLHLQVPEVLIPGRVNESANPLLQLNGQSRRHYGQRVRPFHRFTSPLNACYAHAPFYPNLSQITRSKTEMRPRQGSIRFVVQASACRSRFVVQASACRTCYSLFNVPIICHITPIAWLNDSLSTAKPLATAAEIEN